MGITRFKDARGGGPGVDPIDGPVSGALQMLTLNIDVATGVTKNFKIPLPAGCRFKVTHARIMASAINGSPTIILGLDTNGSSKLVASTAVTTNAAALTVKSASANTNQGQTIVAQVAGSVVGGVLRLVGHISQPPTSLVTRTNTHF